MRSLTARLAFTICLLAPALAIADSSGPSLNPYHAYPPSCLADPLPSAPSGPSMSERITLPLYGVVGSETVTVNLWRTPCSGGTSALLGEFVRDSANANSSPAPEFPLIEVSQGANSNYPVRINIEPNTIRSAISTGSSFFGIQSFVFENWPTSSAAQFTYSQSLAISFVAPDGTLLLTGSIPAYDPSQYATASQPMQISGYMTGAWYDPAHSGEGIQVEVGEAGPPGTAGNRYIVMAWYTYDVTGTPYWLYGEGIFTAGDRTASVSMLYSTGGGFAGNFGASANLPNWGTINVQFPDCNTMQFGYQSSAGLPSGVPTGSGTKTWTRISNMNGLTCE
jgi:hypothetical protein